MRFVVVGAGGVGGTIGARLFAAGYSVVLVARGAHAQVMERDGLRFREPEAERVLRIPVRRVPVIEPGDVVILAVKTQDTEAALAGIPDGTPVVCAQNGISNEAIAARRHEAFGMVVWMGAVHLVPGVVDLHSRGNPGILDLGAVNGSPERAEKVADALRDAGFDSVVRPDIMRWKRAKLVSNAPGAIFAAQLTHDLEAWVQPSIDEGVAVFAASGEPMEPVESLLARCAHYAMAPVAGVERPGGSMWQSVHRGAGLEVAALNGEIVRRGLEFGVPTPVNTMLLEAVLAAAIGARR